MLNTKTNTRVVISATVTRANGTTEDLGVIAQTTIKNSIWSKLIKLIKGE